MGEAAYDYDIVPTFSDSDDIPDLDAAFDNEEESIPSVPKANTGKKRKAKESTKQRDQGGSKRRKHESDESSEDEWPGKWAKGGERDYSFDPDFFFDDPSTRGLVEEGFGEWHVPGADAATRIGVDDIIQRRRQRANDTASHVASSKLQEAKSSRGDAEDSAEEDAEEIESVEDAEWDRDELLDDDAFGMGAGIERAASDEGDQEQDDGDPDMSHHTSRYEEGSKPVDVEDDEDDNDSVAAPVPHPDDLDVSDHSDAEQSDAEEQAKQNAFFATEEPSKASLSQTTTSFQSMHLSRPLLKGLTTVGFTHPTPIQSKAIPMALLGKDVVGGAVTGSGKTAAFVLPIIERLLYRQKRVPTTRVAILTPTRELAVQCHNVATKLAQFTDISFALIVGGLSLREQEATLKKRPDVVIATPGRFIDHMRNSASFAVDGIEILVLDEADRMLEEGFADEINELLKTIPRSRQTMLFSATMTSRVDDLVRAGLNKPVRLVVDAHKTTVPKLIQEFVKIKGGKGGDEGEEQEHRRLAYLLHLCTRVYTSRTIVFLPTKSLAHRVKVMFSLRDVAAAELHGSMSQEQRLGAIAAFRDGRATHLLATDLASRGLDIPRVDTVINFSVPTTSTTYLHRVGRTARAGRGGVSVTIFEGSKTKGGSSSKGHKGKDGGKQSASERALLKPILKIAKAQKAPMRTRTLPVESINDITNEVSVMQEEIDEILREEKEERLLQQTERDMAKSENMIKHEDEIKSRPKRTWFQSEKEKKEAKGKGLNERLALTDGANGSGAVKKEKKKLSGKDKKRLDARGERLEGKTGTKKSKSMAKPDRGKVSKASKSGKKAGKK